MDRAAAVNEPKRSKGAGRGETEGTGTFEVVHELLFSVGRVWKGAR